MKYSWLILCILVLGCVGQTPQEEPEQQPQENPETIDLTDEEILELIDQSHPVVLYWYSSTCSSCHAVKPQVEQLQTEYNLDIIWVNKNVNKQIFELFDVRYYPGIYVYDEFEVYITFDTGDSLTHIYSQIIDGTIRGMHHIDYTTEGNQILIPTKDLLPNVLHYLTYEDHRLFVFISPSGRLFVFTRSLNCPFSWLYIKKDLIYDGENPSQWDTKALKQYGGGCGDIIEIPYSVTGSAIIVNVEDIVW